MFDKWVGKLMEGGSRVYAGMSSKHESISEEEEKEAVEKLTAELAEMKLKVRTNPQLVEEWFDKANRSVQSTQDKQRESSASTTSNAASGTVDNDSNSNSNSNNKDTALKESNSNNHTIAATAMTDFLKEDDEEENAERDSRYDGNDAATVDQEQSQQQREQEQDQEREQELTELLEGSAETALDRISQLTLTAKERLSPIAKSGISQLSILKEEGNDLKKLLSSKEVIIYKTDAIAIMLRKYGGIIEFLDAYDNLIREGYALDHSEPIESFFFEVPINGIKTRLGKLYYFHNRKYTAATMPPRDFSPSSSSLLSSTAAVTGSDGTDSCKKYVAAVFLKGPINTTTPARESQPKQKEER
jgi:hypothetical protein